MEQVKMKMLQFQKFPFLQYKTITYLLTCIKQNNFWGWSGVIKRNMQWKRFHTHLTSIFYKKKYLWLLLLKPYFQSPLLASYEFWVSADFPAGIIWYRPQKGSSPCRFLIFEAIWIINFDWKWPKTMGHFGPKSLNFVIYHPYGT